MLLKSNNLYINEKNIVTLQPFVSQYSYGLTINGIDYKLGEYQASNKTEQNAALGKMKALQTQIIKAINK